MLAGWIACVAPIAGQEPVAADSTGQTAAAPADPAAVPTADAYVPISPSQRIFWTIDGTVGPQSLGTGVFTSAWQTAWNTPDEWGQSWSGFGKRYLEREADVAISNTLEAGFGAIWGEDPRYIKAPHGSIRSRLGWAAKTVLLAPRRDGHLAPAWGRYAGNTLNNLIENTYLPPSFTTPGQTIWRSASGLASRLIYNVWEEFWPDLSDRWFGPHAGPPPQRSR